MEIKELQEVAKEIFKLQERIDQLGTEKTELQKELDALKFKSLEYLEQHGLKNFDAGEEIGKIGTADKRSVSMVDKYAFFEWYKENVSENLEEAFTIPAPTVNKIYNDYYDLAKTEGNIEFITSGIPGLSEPKVHRTIKLYKPKAKK